MEHLRPCRYLLLGLLGVTACDPTASLRVRLFHARSGGACFVPSSKDDLYRSCVVPVQASTSVLWLNCPELASSSTAADVDRCLDRIPAMAALFQAGREHRCAPDWGYLPEGVFQPLVPLGFSEPCEKAVPAPLTSEGRIGFGIPGHGPKLLVFEIMRPDQDPIYAHYYLREAGHRESTIDIIVPEGQTSSPARSRSREVLFAGPR